jgi:hypothetical protein
MTKQNIKNSKTQNQKKWKNTNPEETMVYHQKG